MPIEPSGLLVFGAGLACGFGHCLGMCGPLAAGIALARPGAPPFGTLLRYTAGRLSTYGLLGGAAGAAGSALGLALAAAPFQRAVMAGAGVLVAAMGLAWAGWLPARLFRGAAFPARAVAWIKRSAGTGGGAFPLGILLGFLPCGPVYTVLLSAARSGMEAGSGPAGFLAGAGTALLFGAGTAPALFLAGEAAGRLGARARGGLRAAGGLLMVLVGALYAARGFAS